MGTRKLKALMIIERCNPEWNSVALEGYCYFNKISELVDVTLVTHERNKTNLDKLHPEKDIHYIYENDVVKKYNNFILKISKINNRVVWPLYHALAFPVYSAFNNSVYEKYKDVIISGEFDIVHSITPMVPRYPYKAVKACIKTPFILGPVNGGVPYPKGFQKLARKEFSYLNFLRALGRILVPGYRETYEKADYILAGSTYTKNLINEVFDLNEDKVELFYENGIKESFLNKKDCPENLNAINKTVELLFVGRLVPYKGADMLIEAIGLMDNDIKKEVSLTIVGDGSERKSLEQQVKDLNLENIVNFVGWIEQKKTIDYYRKSDIFCFPSIREFGGAVVLEAMANSLPCVVIDNGGIGEYVTKETGYKINPISRSYAVEELKTCIEELVANPTLRQEMSQRAFERASEFTWGAKADSIVDIYHKVLGNKRGNVPDDA